MNGSGLNDDDNIGQLLAELVRGTDALTVALLRVDGTCLFRAGDTAQVNTTVLSFVVSELVSCCRDVARVVGEDRFSTVVQHGAHRHLHVTTVGDFHVLAVAFEDNRQTGLVRLQARRTATALESLVPTQVVPENNGHASGNPALITRGADVIDRIFAGPHSTERDRVSR